jgi:hypothetical protein
MMDRSLLLIRPGKFVDGVREEASVRLCPDRDALNDLLLEEVA